VRLLLTEDEREAGQLAGLLNRLNQERQRLEEGIIAEAAPGGRSDAVGTDRSGLAGMAPGRRRIRRGRLVERFHRPAVLIALDERVSAGDRPGVSPG